MCQTYLAVKIRLIAYIINACLVNPVIRRLAFNFTRDPPEKVPDSYKFMEFKSDFN